MKYFSLNTVKDAYLSNSETTTNKFWGLISILSAVNTTVVPTVSYNFESNQVSNILNSLFILKEEKPVATKEQSRSIMLSRKWTTYVSDILTTKTPNIFSVLVWYFRHTPLDDHFSYKELYDKFLECSHISSEDAKRIFSFEKIKIEFSETKYSESSLKTALGKQNENITAENSAVVAEPGDFTRGPFLQPLYASQDIMKCLILSTFNLNEYYLDDTTQVTSKKISECIYGPIECGTGKPGMPTFLEGVILSTKNYEKNLDSLNRFFKATANKLYVNKCAIGTEEHYAKQLVIKPNREKDVNFDISWQYNGRTYCVNRELNMQGFNSFIQEYNRAYAGIFEIAIETSEKGTPIYKLYRLINHKGETFQKIYYGSPGTGKSFKVEHDVLPKDSEEFIFRTTFHPDSDYASFVGSYKPLKEGDSITYDFEPQAFTKAYVKAWQNPEDQVYLVIEEINRGNCAQIFGDIFQLLDRKNGVSEYPVNADAALAKYLNETLEGKAAEGIANGKLKIPANLNIIATMNTSDQSLFPMDSAFKRRWDWVYIPTTPPAGKEKCMTLHIGENNKDFDGKTIAVGDYEYKWTEFLKAVNMRISAVTHSDDKQLGFWFVKTPEGQDEISVSTFVSKVIFYLWNDVFKDVGPKSDNPFTISVDDKSKVMTFNSFYEVNSKGKIVENLGVLHTFMRNLGLGPKLNKEIESAQQEADLQDESVQQ